MGQKAVGSHGEGPYCVESIGLIDANPYWHEGAQCADLVPTYKARFWQSRSSTGKDEECQIQLASFPRSVWFPDAMQVRYLLLYCRIEMYHLYGPFAIPGVRGSKRTDILLSELVLDFRIDEHYPRC